MFAAVGLLKANVWSIVSALYLASRLGHTSDHKNVILHTVASPKSHASVLPRV